MKSNKNLIWLDCEMTGLDMVNDVILEVACVITDAQLQVIAEQPSIVIHQPESVLEAMGPWCQKQHKKSGLIEDVRRSTTTLEEAQETLLEFLGRYCFPSTSPLCGSSIWVDRVFLMNYLPKINDFCHYRNVDIAAIKELVARWYSFNLKAELPKREQHRALPDIYESIAELNFYRERFFVTPEPSNT